jgi:hypothetical protein
MSINIVAIATCAPGKEARLDELVKNLTESVEKNEPNVEKYLCSKSKNAEGVVEYVFQERYELPFLYSVLMCTRVFIFRSDS